MKRKIIGLIIVAVAAFSPFATSAAGLDEIVKRGTVRIGVCDFPPWTFTNRGDKLEGFEIDVAMRIARDMGVQPDIRMYALDDVMNAVANGEIDFIAAGLAISPARALKVDFSRPYFSSGVTLVTNKTKTSGIESPDDLNKDGMVVLAVEDTLSADVAKRYYDVAELKLMPDGPAAEKELLEGRAHGFMTSLPSAHVLTLHHADVAAEPLAEPVGRTVAGLAVQHGNQSLLNFLNAWVSSREADRWLEKTHAYWFDGYDWTAHMKPTE